MRAATHATLFELSKAVWFSKVGVRDTDMAYVLSSWEEAIENCASQEWEDLCLHAANEFCMRLSERNAARFARWNEVVEEIKPVTMALVKVQTESVSAEHSLPKVFVDTVNWDILHACMEAEYADVFPPAFYASQAFWYREGHFPCGWRDGQFPGGRLVIY